MPQFFKKLSLFKTLSRKQTVLCFLLFLISALFIPASFAQANWLVSALEFLPSLAIGLVLQLVLWLGELAMQMGNFMVGWSISPWKVSFTNPANNPVIEVGWTLLRDITNMFFILGLAYIGLATALNLAGFNTKKAFANILIAALIINFTPVICGVIVDMANIFANFFLTGIDFRVMADIFSLQRGELWGSLFSLISNYDVLLKVTMLIAYGFGAAVIFLLFAFLFIIRAPIIWILVILSPLAFFAWVFDETKKYFTMWWNWFLQWTIIAVPAGFFLYLSQVLVANADDLGSFSPGDPSGGLFHAIGPYMVGLVFMGLGFMIAMQAATAATGAIMAGVSTATKSVKSAAGTVKKVGKRAAQAGDAAARVTAGYLGGAGGAMYGAVKGVKEGQGFKGRITGAGKGLVTGAGTGAKVGWQAPGVAREKVKEWGAKGLEAAHLVRPGFYERIKTKRYKTAEAEERLKGLSDDKLKKIAERKAIGATEKGERAAAVKILSQRGKFAFKKPDGTMDTEKEKKLIEQAKKAGADLSILAKSRPDLTPEINTDKFKKEIEKAKEQIRQANITITPEIETDVKEVIRQKLITKQVEGMGKREFRATATEEALNSPEVFMSLDAQKIADIGTNGTMEQKRALVDTTVGQEIMNFRNSLSALRIRLMNEGLNIAADDVRDNRQKLYTNTSHIANDINFQGF